VGVCVCVGMCVCVRVCVCVWQRELYELEDKYKKAMMTNAHLDNEKQSLKYEVDLLHDEVDDMKEHSTELQRELRDKTRVGTSHIAGQLSRLLSLYKVLASLGSILTGTHISHWWRQEGHLYKIAPVCQEKSY